MADDNKTKEPKNKETEGQETKLSKKVEGLVDEISKLSVIELSELVNALQDKLGVTAAVPQAAVPAAQSAEEPAEGGSETAVGAAQTVVLTAAGGNKIAVIKALREINQNWGLKEAKDMTEQTPVEVLKDAKAEEAKDASEKLKAAGATVEVK